MRRWSRHAVLAGQLEQHCLLCDETFTSVQQVERHIRWPEHRARRDATISSHNQAHLAHRAHIAKQAHHAHHAHERVYKIRELYYCEACNCALLSEEEASEHVALAEHARRTRESPTTSNTCTSHACNTDKEDCCGGEGEARRVAGGVVLFGEIYCGQRAWNGICGGSCVVCNVSVEEATEHCASRSHLLRLLPARVRRHHTEDLLYRQINEWFFQCVTCNKVLPQSLLAAHARDEQHGDMLARCRLLARRACAAPATPTAPHRGEATRKLARRHTFTTAVKLSPYTRAGLGAECVRVLQLNKTQIRNK